jgi:hypothetical protein
MVREKLAKCAPVWPTIERGVRAKFVGKLPASPTGAHIDCHEVFGKTSQDRRLDFILAGAQIGQRRCTIFMQTSDIIMGDRQDPFLMTMRCSPESRYEQLHKHYPLVAHQPSPVITPSYFITNQRRDGFGNTTQNQVARSLRNPSTPLRIGTCNDSKSRTSRFFDAVRGKRAGAPPAEARRFASSTWILHANSIVFQALFTRASEI